MISVSLVIYCNKIEELTRAIKSVLSSNLVCKIYLIDNSINNELKILENLDEERIEYSFQNKNLGFGAGHNIAIKESLSLGYSFHIVINPDIYFDANIISTMFNYMNSSSDIGIMMPQILNFDNSIQYLPKLLASPISLIKRKFKWPRKLYQKFLNNYELRSIPKDTIINVPIISGCFTMFNMNAIKKVGFYDERFFMYFEDWDLSRRIHSHYKTLYFPLVSINHGYKSGANSNFKLFKIFMLSAIKYFNKWGWFFDYDRVKFNNQVLNKKKA
jgi:hypothetical protein